MNPKDNMETKAVTMAALMSELHRSKTNEKRLMDQNTLLKKDLSKLVTADTCLKKEQVEVAMLRNKAREQDLHVDQLRKDLEKVKAKLKNEETERAHEKSTSEQKIMFLEKLRLEFQNKFYVEKSLREQKEKELEMFTHMEGENKKLHQNGQMWYHQVQELTGYKNFATKKIEEQVQQLKKKDVEHDQTKEELDKERLRRIHYKVKADKLLPYRDRYESTQSVAEKQANAIKKHRKQADAFQKKIHQLTRETASLTMTIEELTTLKNSSRHQSDQLQIEMNSLTLEFENYKKEAEKQRNIILHLESELNSNSDLRSKLENKKREINRKAEARDQEIIHLRNLITLSENMQRMHIIKTDNVKAEKDVIEDKLSKAEVEIGVKCKIIEELNDVIKGQTLKSHATDADLVKINRECRSVKSKLESLKRQLAEAKITQEICTASVGKDKIVLQKKLSKVVAEKDKLDKELQHYTELVMQLQQKNNLQEAAMVAQEHTLKEYKEEVSVLRLENQKLELHSYIMEKKTCRQFGQLQALSRRGRIRKRNLHPSLQMMYDQHRQYQFFGRKLQQDKKDKEIEELKCMLARRPDNAIERLHRCQWNNRLLNKRFVASQGLSTMYMAKYESTKEENSRLTDELRKLKLEHGVKSRHTRFPPISSKSQSPSPIVDNSKDQCESGHLSRHRRFPLISAKSQCQSEDNSKIAPLPPIVQCCGKKIRPHPPPPLSKEV